MDEFKRFYPLQMIEKEMGEVEEILRALLDRGEGFVREVGIHLLTGGGKRIRPALTLLSAEAAGGSIDEAVPLAAAVELLHTATLVHDDVVDDSPLRRGMPTINQRWGNDVSVLTGDFLFGEAFLLLVQRGDLGIVRLMADMVTRMCRAEIDQMSNLYNIEQGIEDYLQRIRGKTAIFFSACCEVGGLLARASREAIGALADYGLNLGMAFQIVDDLLDLLSEEGTVGKPVGSDLMEGILTLPVILLLEDDSYREEVRGVFANRRVTPSDVARIKEVLHRAGAFDRSREIARGFMEDAKSALHPLREGRGKSALLKMADYVLERKV